MAMFVLPPNPAFAPKQDVSTPTVMRQSEMPN